MSNNLKNRVRQQVGGMGGDEFERFMIDLLPCIFSEFNIIEPTFNAQGKTTKGKCDAHVHHKHDDTYTAFIFTTKQSDIRSKIIEDINKLKTTHFAAKIRKVLLCVNTQVQDEVELYRKTCSTNGWGFEPVSLERITQEVLGQEKLLTDYFHETVAKTASSVKSRKFDCGNRLKEAREDLSMPISVLIENLDFPSEKEWGKIENRECEVDERYIEAMANFSGVSAGWLKHAKPAKYQVETIHDFQKEKVKLIASSNPMSSFMVINPADMRIALVVRFTETHWRSYQFGFNLDFAHWQGDSHHIPIIYELLQSINTLLRYPHGREVTEELLSKYTTGDTHPSLLIRQSGNNSHWFDDLFDLDHHNQIAPQYKHYGEWFIELQNQLRIYGRKK